MSRHGGTPFWKREVSFGRKAKPKALKAERAPSPPPARERTPFWKREVSFGRKAKPKALKVERAPSPPPARERTPFWKREIRFGRKRKVAYPPLPEEAFVERLRTFTARPLYPDIPPPVASQAAPLAVPPVSTGLSDPPVTGWEDAEATVETPSLVPEAAEPVGPWVEPEPEFHLEPKPPPPEPEPEPAQPRTRGERNDARRAADRLAKEQRRQAKEAAREERKAMPTVHRQVVGLKVGASQIAAAQVVNKGGPRIVRMARMPLEPGVVVAGELRESEELTAALKIFFRKNKLPRTCVRLGISNNRIGVRTFEITGIEDPKQLANAIRFRAQETLPIPLDEAVLDYRILEERVGEDGVIVRRVLLVVAHRELVDRYVAACRKAGLKLIGIDLEAFGLLRAVGDPDRVPAAADDAGLVCLSIGHERTTLAVSDGRICQFTRVLSWGGSALDVAIARVLDLTPSEAEPIRRELSFAEQGEVAGLDERRADEARRAMASELQAFARELVASLRFYQEQEGSLGISEILVTGGAIASPGLAEELGRLIGVDVRVADPLARVKLPRKLRASRSGPEGSMAIAVGLGIED